MAKQSNLKYSGRVGNIIYYESLGGYYIRSRPGTVRRTTASKTSAGKFGQANSLSKTLRHALAPMLPGPTERNMMHRFTNAIYQWLLSGPVSNDNGSLPVPQLTGFEFNEKSSLKERLKLPLQITRPANAEISLCLTAMNPGKVIAAPHGTEAVELRVIMVCCSLQDAALYNLQSNELIIPYHDVLRAAQVITLSCPAAPGQLCLLVIAIRYHLPAQSSPCNLMEWLPVMIADAIYTGT